MLEIRNHGPLILQSNYWELPAALAGKFLISINAGAFRLLVPASQEGLIEEFATAKGIAVTRGPMPELGLLDGFEVLFDDATPNPFKLDLSPESFDRVPAPEDVAGDWVFSAWTRPRRGKPRKALERPCLYRLAARLPDMRPWESH